MCLRSSRVRVQIASVPLLAPAHITTTCSHHRLLLISPPPARITTYLLASPPTCSHHHLPAHITTSCSHHHLPAHITTSCSHHRLMLTSPPPQELNSARTQGNCQGKNFLIPKVSQKKKAGGERTGVTTTTDPPFAKSPTQLTNILMGITVVYTRFRYITSYILYMKYSCTENVQN